MTAQLLQLSTTPDLADQVYRALLDAISEGSLAPGQRITQEELAEQLAVSRQPVMQALRLLKKDGLIEDAPGRGVQVTPLDSAWVGHLYEVRGALDALAARLAEAAADGADTEVQLRADAAVPYGRVVEVMGAAHAAGLQRIGFVAEPAKARAP